MQIHDAHQDNPSHRNPRSTARIGGHPIHPMLVPFPIVCFIGAFVADGLFAWTGSAAWTTAALWLIGFGLGFAALAAIAGLTDFLGDPLVRGHADAVKHLIANATAIALEAVNLVLRLTNGPATGTGIYLSALVALILLYSGWKGGELVFRHGVGVLDKDAR